MKPLQVYIGYDPNEAVAYHVLAHSIMRRSSCPVSVTPLYRSTLEGMGAFTRKRGVTESTEFSMTRFLVPWLSGYSGVSIFMDCDMLCLGDVAELADYAFSDPYKDLFCVHHLYHPTTGTKFLGQQQSVYPRKNWSSVMVFNGHRQAVRNLTPPVVSNADASYLHQMKWARDIGELPLEWNHLVGEYPENPEAKLVHYTLGGPYFPEYFGCEYTEHWYAEAANALRATGDTGHLLRHVQESSSFQGESDEEPPDAKAQAGAPT